ncbi:MAG: hypothetical protein U0670_04035 [Anaerolineae bacterium]
MHGEEPAQMAFAAH